MDADVAAINPFFEDAAVGKAPGDLDEKQMMFMGTICLGEVLPFSHEAAQSTV